MSLFKSASTAVRMAAEAVSGPELAADLRTLAGRMQEDNDKHLAAVLVEGHAEAERQRKARGY